MRIYQSVKHTKRTGSKVMKAGWMVHFTQNDPVVICFSWIERKRDWTLTDTFFVFHVNYKTLKYIGMW